MAPRALIVDDEPSILQTLSGVLSDQGVDCLGTTSGEEALALYAAHRPEVVFLDIWLPDRDGLETLQAICASSTPSHGDHDVGPRHHLDRRACDQDGRLRLPREAADLRPGRRGAARRRSTTAGAEGRRRRRAAGLPRRPPSAQMPAPPALGDPARGPRAAAHHRATSSVIYGLGLHSGGRTGMVMQPLPPDSGIHFLTLPSGTPIPAHLDSVGETDYATTLVRDGAEVRTVEHLLSALHAAGITNLLVKVHGEVPVLDGSARRVLPHASSEIGVEDQDVPRREVVIDRRYEVSCRRRQGPDGRAVRRLRGLLPAALSAADRRAVLRVRHRLLRRATATRSPRRAPSASCATSR